MKRITKLTICLTALCFISTFSFADKVDDIIAKHIRAHGGADNWNKIESLKLTGDYTSFSMTNSFTTYKTKEGKYYFDHHKGIKPVIEAYDGEKAWTLNPWFDIDYPRGANTYETNAFLQKAELCTPFLNYKEKGYKVEYIGKEDFEGVKVHRLDLTRDNGLFEIWYLDAKTYLEYAYISTWHNFGGRIEAETFFDDFREVSGVILPYYTERSFGTRHRVWEINDVEINPALDDICFSMPLSNEINKLKSIVGEWNVKVEGLTRRGMIVVDSTTSTICLVDGMNLIQQNISYENYFPFTGIMNWTFNSNTNKYRMTGFNSYQSNMEVFEGTFNNDTLCVDNSLIRFTKEDNPEAPIFRFKITDRSDDRFVFEFDISRDNGENWRTRERFTYTRKE